MEMKQQSRWGVIRLWCTCGSNIPTPARAFLDLSPLPYLKPYMYMPHVCNYIFLSPDPYPNLTHLVYIARSSRPQITSVTCELSPTIIEPPLQIRDSLDFLWAQNFSFLPNFFYRSLCNSPGEQPEQALRLNDH